MTLRAAILGVTLGLLIAAATYFNDSVLHQSPLIGHFLPVGVVAPVVLWALLINPLLGRLGAGWALRGREMLLIAAVAFAACSFPGNGFFRWFATNQAMPAHLIKTEPAWQAADVMAYVPADTGVLLLDGRDDDRVVQDLRIGRGGTASLADVPWDAWRPVVLRWGGLAVLLGLASVCLAVIVHPQWAHHERLAYPVVRFLENLTPAAGGANDTGRDPPGSPGDPAAPRLGRLFYWGLGITLTLHLLNGLFATGWSLFSVSTSFSFHPLMQLFPHASQAEGSNLLFQVTLVPSVIAFCWFVQTRVTLAIGLSNLFWVVLGGAMLAGGTSLATAAQGHAPAMLSLGASVGVAVMIAYVGRRHYLAVLGRMVGFTVDAERPPPASCVWAARLFTLLVAASVYWLSAAGLHWSLALAFVLLLMLMFLVIARINVETGLIFIQLAFGPAAVLLAWCGFEALGPTTLLVLMIAQVMLLSDPRQVLLAFVANALKLADRGPRTVGRTAPILAGVMIASFVVAGAFTLTTQYSRGIDTQDWFATNAQPAMPFDQTAREVTRAQAFGTMPDAEAARGFDWIGGIARHPAPLAWAAAGFTLFVGCAWLMLRLPWWPIHPVLFVVWGTLPSMWFGWSFLIGWLIKSRVVAVGGATAFKQLTPLMVGLIAGEMVAALGWIAFGWAQYALTGTVPQRYSILPA